MSTDTNSVPPPVTPPTKPTMPTPPTPPTVVPHRRTWLWVVLVVVLFLGLSYLYDQMLSGQQATTEPFDDRITPLEETSSSSTDLDEELSTPNTAITQVAAPTRTVTEAGAFQLATASAGNCTMLKPTDWGKPVPAEGSRGLDVANTEKTMYAGYGIQPINTQLAGYASYYQPPLNDPGLYSEDPATVTLAYAKILVNGLGGSTDLTYTSEVNETLGDYRLRSIGSSTHTGVLFYHGTGFPGDGYNYSYALPMYFALTRADLWSKYGLMVAQVAASIRCTATLVPRAASGPDIASSSSGSDTKDENGTDAGYNPQLGTEYVHDPTTGENYLVDPSQHWSENGPNGAGYYAGKGGGDYVQLQPGRVD